MVGTHTLPSLSFSVSLFISLSLPHLFLSLFLSLSLFCFFFLPYLSSPLPFTLFCFLSLSLSLSPWLDQSHGGEEHKSPMIAACVLGLCSLVNMIGVVHSLKYSCFFLLYCYVIPPITARFSFSVALFFLFLNIPALCCAANTDVAMCLDCILQAMLEEKAIPM